MRLSAVFIAVATVVSGVRAGSINGNFSGNLEKALITEFGLDIFNGLKEKKCQPVPCALSVGKATPCVLTAVMGQKLLDIPACFNSDGNEFHLLCHCLDCYVKAIKDVLNNSEINYCPTSVISPDLFSRVYLNLASDEEKSKAKAWGFTPPPTTED
ncbi:hypothetical protein PC9H_000063 [Pleurotus ostreatus]|uniref:Uncharacterized protein n=1 Tax=Pleurotus ostreatus TaxID=5322 RepID=A0A8H7A407_PLEOS|nr:uncharacterized protein PC9H_000063 [Pleurotus ostreatus]KAF7439727.1 hypothetical protein PC9H_000063 [Pleurotus ostreatus]